MYAVDPTNLDGKSVEQDCTIFNLYRFFSDTTLSNVTSLSTNTTRQVLYGKWLSSIVGFTLNNTKLINTKLYVPWVMAELFETGFKHAI